MREALMREIEAASTTTSDPINSVLSGLNDDPPEEPDATHVESTSASLPDTTSLHVEHVEDVSYMYK